MASVIRSVKNVTKGYSSVQVKVRNGMVPSRTGSGDIDFQQLRVMMHGVLPAQK